MKSYLNFTKYNKNENVFFQFTHEENLFLELAHIKDLEIKFDLIKYTDYVFYLYNNSILFELYKKQIMFINYNEIWLKLNIDNAIDIRYITSKLINFYFKFDVETDWVNRVDTKLLLNS